MMRDEETAATRCPAIEIEPEKFFGPSIKSIKFLGSVGQNWGRSGFRKQQFLGGLTTHQATYPTSVIQTVFDGFSFRVVFLVVYIE